MVRSEAQSGPTRENYPDYQTLNGVADFIARAAQNVAAGRIRVSQYLHYLRVGAAEARKIRNAVIVVRYGKYRKIELLHKSVIPLIAKHYFVARNSSRYNRYAYVTDELVTLILREVERLSA